MAKKKKNTAAAAVKNDDIHALREEILREYPIAPALANADIQNEKITLDMQDSPPTVNAAEASDTEAEPIPAPVSAPQTMHAQDSISVPAEDASCVSEEPALTPEPVTEEERASLLRDNAELAFIGASKDNNVFVESLDGVTADDLGKPPKKKKKDPIDMIIGFVRQAIFWIAVVVFFVSGYEIVYKLYAYKQAEKIYDIDFEQMMQRREDLIPTALRDTRLTAMTPVNGTREESGELTDAADSYEYNEMLEVMKGQLMILRNKNEEVIGWIRMEGDTEINYPIVQHEDNDYYLHYAYDGTYNPAGSIYLDYKNKVAVGQNRHTIIYGHNMESGSPMFANLLHFKDESYWKDNRYIEIYTDEALYTYEVFAAYETDPSQTALENHSWRMNFKKDDKIFMSWLDTLKERSDISPDVPLDADSRVLTLSTCMNVNENRYVVHAVLVDTDK